MVNRSFPTPDNEFPDEPDEHAMTREGMIHQLSEMTANYIMATAKRDSIPADEIIRFKLSGSKLAMPAATMYASIRLGMAVMGAPSDVINMLMPTPFNPDVIDDGFLAILPTMNATIDYSTGQVTID